MKFVDKLVSVLEIIYDFLTTTKSNAIDWFNRVFEIKSSKKAKITAAIITGVLFVCVFVLYREFVDSNFAARWYLFSGALILPMIIGLMTGYTIRFKDSHKNKIAKTTSLFIMPFFAIAIAEALNGVFIFNMKPTGVLGNYIVILLLYLFVFAICGSFKITYLTINTIILGFSIAHCYIMEFRGVPLVPSDLWSIGTAGAVANTYDFTPPAQMILAVMLFIFVTVFAIKLKTPKYKLTSKIICRVIAGTLSFVLMFTYFKTDFFVNLGIKPYFWNMSKWYNEYGFVYNFFCNARYISLPKPSGYDHKTVGDKVGGVNDNSEEDYQNSSKNPNIICIMNESLTDFSVLGDFETNEDYMPFMRSLTENTIKGYTYVPVVGAGTSNTEFEFLTGHSTAFLPAQSNVYMLYLDNPLASLVSTLEAQNYSSLGFHPYYASGWDRTDVYSNFGFDNFTSIEDMVDEDLYDYYKANSSNPNDLQEYIDINYPELTDMFVRQYVSDSYNYKWLIEDYENRDKEKSYFVFNVTMQNHGGYTAIADNFEEKIYTTSLSKQYPKANQYLSLVKESDDAFKELIEYFSKVKEPTVICMFGDHHPTVEKEFIAEIMGIKSLSSLSIRQNQLRHATPFFIWANYDIEEEYIEQISVNYLSSMVLKTAGLELTRYNKYLLDLAKELPVIDTVGYIDKDGRHYAWEDKSPYTEMLNDYDRIQYNNLADQEHVDTGVFYIDGYVHTPTEITEDY